MLLKFNLLFLNKFGKYLENLPDIFTDDKSKAKSVLMTYDTDDDTFEAKAYDEMQEYVEGIAKYQGEISQKIEMYSEDMSVQYGKIVLTTRGLSGSADPSVTPEVVQMYKSLTQELVQIGFEISIKIATSSRGSISKLMKDAEAMGMGPGLKGSLKGTKDVDLVIDAINEKTKATVSKPDVTLDDYICNDILKEELNEIKNFMEKYDEYIKLGIQLPKGILFKGDPGTGKTYAARCIAGSTDCYFLSCTASSLQGMYIGSGTQNIRDVFEGAKKLLEVSGKGVIIFIDEIDSLGNRDENHGAGGEENRTLNQLLAEMSGFEESQKIMVMAATNYEQRLDSALKRSGRFSRHINIDLPDEDEREYLIEYYFKKISLPLDLSYIELVDITENLTPADIKEIANEAAILTVRQSLSKITLDNVNEAINKVITKNIRNKDKLDINLVSAHEAGHTLAEWIYTNSLATKVTSYSYGDAGGFTQSSFKLKGIMPKDKFIAEIKILLAGRAAEQVMCGYITGGASSDLDRAKKIMNSYYKDYNFDAYEVEKLNQIVIDEINKLQRDVIEDFEKQKDTLKTLTENLIKNRVLYKKDLAALLITDEGGLF